MRTLKNILCVAAVGVIAGACATAPTTDDKAATVNTPVPAATTAASTPLDELATARKNYQEYCIRCHKADGVGGENDFEGNPIKVPNFTTEKMKKMSDATFTKYINNGEEGEMPAFKDKLTPDEIKGLVKMIRTDFQGGVTEPGK